MARGEGGRLFEGGDYFKYFGQRGNEAKQVSIVQPKLTGLQKSEAFDRNCFKTFQERENFYYLYDICLIHIYT